MPPGQPQAPVPYQGAPQPPVAVPGPPVSVPPPPGGLPSPGVAPAPGVAVPGAPVVAAPPPVVLPPPVWDPRDAQELLTFIQQIGGEGLDPADYDPAGLTDALQTGSIAAISQAATERFNKVSSDLALGHVRREDRIGWNIRDRDLDSARQDWLLRTALYEHRVQDRLRELLPIHPQYRDLKNALSITPRTETAKMNRIRLNMDRWRWLPRDLGNKYIIVNVPAFYARWSRMGRHAGASARWRAQ